MNLNAERDFRHEPAGGHVRGLPAGGPPRAAGPDLIIENGISGLLCGTVPELAAALDKTTAAMGHAAQSRVNENFLWQNSAELALTLLPKKGKSQWITTILCCRRPPTSTAVCASQMKYRGVNILPAAAGNDLARDLLESGQPFLFGRCGATEMRTVADWLQNGGHNFDGPHAGGHSAICPASFPPTMPRWTNSAASTSRLRRAPELLALWNVGAEREVIRGCDATRFTELRALGALLPRHARGAPPSRASGCSSVHPFRRTILAQYEKRSRSCFPAKNVLPELACLTVIQAVQGLGGQDTGYADWFDALTEMERRMDAADYDVAIVGAGAYSLPLAAHARDTGHAAIQMSGATQLLFGIKGKRWDDHPVISKLYNPAWVRPDETEGISNKEKVEGGSYW